MDEPEQGIGVADPPAPLTEAADWFLRLRSEDANADDLSSFQRWLENSPDNPPAYRRISASWAAVGEHASAPEVIMGRRNALDSARRAAQSHWKWPRTKFFRQKYRNLTASSLRERTGGQGVRLSTSAIVGAAFLVSAALWFQTRADLYSTGVGERRTLTLADGSVVTLDARTRIHVKYRKKERLISLDQGQARFDVAKDSSRPFRVKAGNETVVALGTQFNVEILGQNVVLTMIEGQVAVTVAEATSLFALGNGERPAERGSGAVELTGGEALRVQPDGKAIRVGKVNVERVTAWQSGKIFFDNAPLSSAAERFNRYSREQIQVDPSVAAVNISGAFNAGDSAAFIEAVTSYFPVNAERSAGSTIRLFARNMAHTAVSP
jgi:transmembrane sensor